jgi:DNA-3-methyladenine glycosylase I
MARYDDTKITSLMDNPGIVRNHLKINAVIKNAQGYLDIQSKLDSFSSFLWGFVGAEPIVNNWTSMSQLPATSPESEAMSKSLKSWGFSFVGPTICYAFMQAVGIVNDHTIDCFRYVELEDSG